MRLKRSQREEARLIAKELARIACTAEVLPGSIVERMTRCGRAGCACQAEPPRRHGPYWQWTRKVAKKTVSRWLGREEAGECRAWIDNDRRLRELVARLEAIGIDRLEADLRRD